MAKDVQLQRKGLGRPHTVQRTFINMHVLFIVHKVQKFTQKLNIILSVQELVHPSCQLLCYCEAKRRVRGDEDDQGKNTE